MEQPNTKLTLIGSSIAAVGLVTCALSTALDYWYYLSQSAGPITVKLYFGLWEFCLKQNDNKQCQSWSKINSAAKASGLDPDIAWLLVCRAFMIMATAGIAAGVAIGFLVTFLLKTNRPMMIVSGLLNVISGSFALVAVAIFAAKYENGLSDSQLGGSLHAAFGLAIVTIILAKVGGYMILRARRQAFMSSYP